MQCNADSDMETPGQDETNQSPSNVGSLETPTLRRTRVACKACNQRRVKCDAGEGQPCWHCCIRQTPCELIDSRRGKYTRRKKGPGKSPRASKHPKTPRAASIRENGGSPSVADASDRAIFLDTNDGATRPGPSHVGEGPPQHSQPPQPDQINPSLRTQHLGDSSLSYTVEVVYSPEGGSSEPLKVRYPIPASISNRAAPSHETEVKEPVSLQEALELPPKDIADQLVRTFFEIIHPAYPVFDRKKFANLYSQNQASPLVLHTIFLLGFTIGSESLVQQAGHSSRATARRKHYLRAKALYDADYDNDRSNVVACLLLLGFWWAGPEDQKDTCYWVGCATNVAQSTGMHRSISDYGLSPSVRSLWKRIWWSIYIRDRHTAAAFGRPCRIQDEDCDVEPPTAEDFLFDDDYDHSLITPQKDFHISYFLEMTKLTVILGDVLKAEFSPRRPAMEKFETGALAARLAQWESQLPNQLQSTPPDGSLGASFWASMLQFSYQNYHILIFRPKAIESLSSAETERDSRARMAADRITRLAEDLLATGAIKYAQIHLVPALFGALAINTISICRNDPVRRELAQNKSRQCMLALSQLASWPVRTWILKAFVNLMKRLTGLSSGAGGSIISVTSNVVNDGGNTAAWGDMGSDLPQHTTGSQNPSQSMNEPQSLHLRSDQGPQPSFIHRSEFGNIHAGDLSQLSDQVMNDSFWAGYVDNMFDSDLLLHESTGPLFSLPPENLTGRGEPSTSDM